MSEKITVIDRLHREEPRNVVTIIMRTKPKFLVARDEMLAALVTPPLSQFLALALTTHLTKFYGWTIISKLNELFGSDHNEKLGWTYSNNV